MSSPQEPIAAPSGIHHVRLTVTDIDRSKAFYIDLLGMQPRADFSEHAADPAARSNPAQLFAGCIFQFGDQILGLRPVGQTGDHFDPTRIGLDHVSLAVGSVADLESAAQRLTERGITHGGVQELEGFGMTILSIQDPDDINLELIATS